MILSGVNKRKRQRARLVSLSRRGSDPGLATSRGMLFLGRPKLGAIEQLTFSPSEGLPEARRRARARAASAKRVILLHTARR